MNSLKTGVPTQISLQGCDDNALFVILVAVKRAFVTLGPVYGR